MITPVSSGNMQVEHLAAYRQTVADQNKQAHASQPEDIVQLSSAARAALAKEQNGEQK